MIFQLAFQRAQSVERSLDRGRAFFADPAGIFKRLVGHAADFVQKLSDLHSQILSAFLNAAESVALNTGTVDFEEFPQKLAGVLFDDSPGADKTEQIITQPAQRRSRLRNFGEFHECESGSHTETAFGIQRYMRFDMARSQELVH